MRIELRTAPGCPNAAAARKTITECLATLGIDVPIIDRVGRYPSPTVLIDGVDVMRPDAGEPVGEACRLDLPIPQRVLQLLGDHTSRPTEPNSAVEPPADVRNERQKGSR